MADTPTNPAGPAEPPEPIMIDRTTPANRCRQILRWYEKARNMQNLAAACDQVVKKGIIAWAETRVPSWRSEESESLVHGKPFPPDWLEAKSASRSSCEGHFTVWMKPSGGEQQPTAAYQFRGGAPVQTSSGPSGSLAADLGIAALNLETVSNPNNSGGGAESRGVDLAAPANVLSLRGRQTTGAGVPPQSAPRHQSANASSSRGVAFEQQQRDNDDDGHANIVGAFPRAVRPSSSLDQRQGPASSDRQPFTVSTRALEPYRASASEDVLRAQTGQHQRREPSARTRPNNDPEEFTVSTRPLEHRPNNDPEEFTVSTRPLEQYRPSASEDVLRAQTGQHQRREPSAHTRPNNDPEEFTVLTRTPELYRPSASEGVLRAQAGGRQQREPFTHTRPNEEDIPRFSNEEELREFYRWWRRRHEEKKFF